MRWSLYVPVTPGLVVKADPFVCPPRGVWVKQLLTRVHFQSTSLAGTGRPGTSARVPDSDGTCVCPSGTSEVKWRERPACLDGSESIPRRG